MAGRLRCTDCQLGGQLQPATLPPCNSRLTACNRTIPRGYKASQQLLHLASIATLYPAVIPRPRYLSVASCSQQATAGSQVVASISNLLPHLAEGSAAAAVAGSDTTGSSPGAGHSTQLQEGPEGQGQVVLEQGAAPAPPQQQPICHQPTPHQPTSPAPSSGLPGPPPPFPVGLGVAEGAFLLGFPEDEVEVIRLNAPLLFPLLQPAAVTALTHTSASTLTVSQLTEQLPRRRAEQGLAGAGRRGRRRPALRSSGHHPATQAAADRQADQVEPAAAAAAAATAAAAGASQLGGPAPDPAPGTDRPARTNSTTYSSPSSQSLPLLGPAPVTPHGDPGPGPPRPPSPGPSLLSGVQAGRLVFLVGGAAALQCAAPLNDLLLQLGLAPALVAAAQPSHADLSLLQVRDRVRAAHAEYYRLVRPLQLPPSFSAGQLPPSFHLASESGQAEVETQSGSGMGGGERPREEGERGSRAGQGLVLDQLLSTRVSLSLSLDAGQVPSSSGGSRYDAAELVVLDGLLREEERCQLLDWLTHAGHDHSGPPPEDKWELACVDRVGDQATWGLRQHMLQALEHDPPAALLALQARLAALYPEYQLCHMPADMLSEDAGEAGEEEGGAGLSSFVGNAVMAGDPCSWHDDANPAMLPPTSPWVHCYGYYYNREPGRPRFVSMLLYLNEAWPDELHAETLFVDPSTQVGVFARPAPGRVVLMDQDTSHRISPPSAVAAGAPRYSLVWKMVWLPRDDPTLPTPARLLRSSNYSGGLPIATDPSHATDSGSCLACSSPSLPGVCRPEWGPPLRLGSAGEPVWRAAWQPAAT
ncbi:hypothetical protein V8C86DRAFT_280056 [Haematococcus lacustris]